MYMRLILALMLTLAATNIRAAETPPTPVPWPDVLVIDDFSTGLDKWENRDSGRLSLTEGPGAGQQALLWTSTDDSEGELFLKELKREEIDFSQYDLLVFDIKVSGRPIWNIGPRLQQYPAVYGFLGLYYSIDTLHPFDKWYTYSQDLSRWENAWPDTFDATRQEFSFGISQLAAAGQTEIALANIRLVKNPLGIKPSYPGRWGRLPDGSQTTHFAVELANRRDRALTVRVGLDTADRQRLTRFQATFPQEAMTLLPGERRTVAVALTATSEALKDVTPWYGETARLAVRVDEIPSLALYTDLTAGSKPETDSHPTLLCGPDRMRELQALYANPTKRSTLNPALLRMVAAGDTALAYEPEYPPTAMPGVTTDPVSGGKLQQIDVPNLPFAVYQDPISGRTYSGPLFDAGMQKWLAKHMANAAHARTLGLAYLVSGRKEFAQAAARILRAYIDRYLALPVSATPPGSPVASATSGSVRIDGTYMRERIWLGNLAVALDAIHPADVLTEVEVQEVSDKIFVPSAMNMMDHKVGVMNLQMQIQSAALYAALAVGDPGLVAQAVYGSHGALRVMEAGYLADGNWWENPSYQNVMNLCAYPVLAVCLRNGILQPEPHLAERLTSYYRLAAPDGFTPELGTGGGRNAALDNTAGHVFAPLIADPRLTWIAVNRKPAAHVGELYAMAILGGSAPLVPPEQAVSPLATATVDFPDYGGIAMRIPDSDAYAYLQYGREVTHGHLNKLSLHAYGKGGWYLRNVMGGYQNNFHDFLETIASSTSIMIDGRNAHRDTGELLFHKTADGMDLVCARENAAWAEGEHTRAVVLTRGPLVIIDRCRANDDDTHTYDWLYHAHRTKLSLDVTEPLPPGPERLGDTPLYSGLHSAGRFPTVGAVAWKRDDGSGMRMALLPRGELFHTEITDTFRPSEGLVWRQRGKTVYFAAVLWPYAKDEAGAPTIEELPVTGDGYAVRVSAPEGVWTVIVNYGDGEVAANGITTRERMAVEAQPAAAE